MNCKNMKSKAIGVNKDDSLLSLCKNNLNTLDTLLLVPLFYGAYNGYKKGILSQLANLLALSILFVFGSFIVEIVKTFLIDNNIVEKSWNSLVGYTVAAFLIFFSMRILAKFLRKIIKSVGLGFFERLGGAFFGFMKVFLIFIISYFIFEPINNKLEIIPTETLKSSTIVEFLEIGKNKVQNLWVENMQ